jgi:integrase/recombinase XerD
VTVHLDQVQDNSQYPADGGALEPLSHPLHGVALRPDDLSRLSRITSAWLAKFRSEHTRVCYRRDLKDWITHCARLDCDPLAAKPMDVDDWIAHQRNYGVTDDGEPAAESSIARRVSTISSWYRYIIRNTAGDDRPLIAYNPADTDARPKIDPDDSPTVGLSRAEANRLMAAADADGTQSATLIRLLLVNGLRCGSAIGADVEGLGHNRGHRTLRVPWKGGKHRAVVIPPNVGEVIDRALAARGNPAAGPLLTANGRRMTEPYVFRLIRRLARTAGIAEAERLSPHSLRHTAITELFESGASLRDVQDFAGHADPRTTRRYDRARNSLDRHGAYALAARFGSTADEVREDGSHAA